MAQDQTSDNPAATSPARARHASPGQQPASAHSAASQINHKPSDLDLIEHVQSGDEAALAALYDRYSSLVFAVCLRITHNHMDAEEALLDTFWQLWQRPDRFDPSRGSVRGYLLVAARSRALDRRRQSGKHSQTLPVHQDTAPSGEAQGSTEPPCDDAAFRESRTKLLEAMQGLTQEQRDLIELSYFDGLSHRQIAECKRQPLGTVKTRIRQALIQLRDSLRTLQ